MKNRTCGVGTDKTFGNIPRSRDAQNAALAFGGDSGASWPDGGGLLPRRESRQER